MPRLSVADCEALLEALEERLVRSSRALRPAARLRQRFEQAMVSKATSGPIFGLAVSQREERTC